MPSLCLPPSALIKITANEKLFLFHHHEELMIDERNNLRIVPMTVVDSRIQRVQNLAILLTLNTAQQKAQDQERQVCYDDRGMTLGL
ncbi:Solute Carrier Family 12 Member 2 [Manis pentadactyla]|nr:Solute Carrier Family 12 Member 2 [Manis pentadactyla]